ncbi:MAG: YlbF family regulator [Enterococcus viikkiensis]|uniref:YlbF family regulator n=1 Tax=Enterococcus viikkiensis TaxID=930854 RepID=A0ABU3FRP4_9ENTE|nr:YlbF family regulator [Enterococcus viikkiensis]MDT2828342.1 YlbF family regulator [Enterococcus viikkiensis]
MNLEKEAAVEAALNDLTALLKKNDVIIDYQRVQQRVAESDTLKQLEDEIKEAQKAAVQYAHYGKPEAEKAALKEADRLTKAFDQHPLVTAYRDQLVEANDLLQHLTHMIQKEVNDTLEADDSKTK